MRFSRMISAAALGAVCGAGFGAAFALEISGPVDIPPPGYTGRQFVDSAGCVFVRAGVGTSVSWVARVDRSGAHLCGYAPTIGATAQAAAETAPPAAAAGQPLATIALTTTPPPPGLTARPVITPVAAAPAIAALPFAPPPAAEAAPATPGRYVSPYVADSGAVAASLPTIVSVETVANAQSACPNLSPVAQRYMLSDGRHVVRCGPQTADPVGYINGAGVPGLQVAGGAPVVAVSAAQVAHVVPTPPGYRSAWNDDRLNPYRGVATARGSAQMAQLWTETVPARLVVAAAPARLVVAVAETREDAGAPTGFADVVISSKSAPAQRVLPGAASVQMAAGARFVQVGTYGVPANADASRARLRALGLPVASSQVVQGGRALQIMYAGPFDSAEALRGALGLARGAGFSDAFAR